MKKTIHIILAMIMTLSMLVGCEKKKDDNDLTINSDNVQISTNDIAIETNDNAEESELITIQINTNGFGGQVASADEGESPEFDDEYPMQSIVTNIDKNTKMVIAAKADEGSKFLKWTRNGVEFSKEAQITVADEEDAEYVAIFGIAGSAKDSDVDIDSVKTMGELFGLPNYGSAYNEENYVYVFETDGDFYRAIADMPADVSKAVWEMDFEDEKYEEKINKLISPLKIAKIENLSDAVPTQEELDKLVGKTGEELLEDNWYSSGYDLDSMEFTMGHGLFLYTVTFEGKVEVTDDFDENEAIKPLKVKSVVYYDLGDTTNLDVQID